MANEQKKPDILNLKIVTPKGTFYEGDVDKFSFRAASGDMQILKNHAPVMSLVGYGLMHIFRENDKKLTGALIGGTVFVENNNILVTTEDASWPDDINKERALKAKERAAEHMKKSDSNFERAEIALKKALVRIDLANIAEKEINRRK